MPTPRPHPPPFRIMPKPFSYQSLDSPTITKPVGNMPYSPIEPQLPKINVISPSTASHRSVYSDTEEDFQSPRLAFLNRALAEEPDNMDEFVSESMPHSLPGDELLYDIATEEMPDEPYFDPVFQASLKKAKRGMEDVELALRGRTGFRRAGSGLRALKQRAQRLGQWEPRTAKKVALVGRDGGGRGGVVNALLDVPHLAHEEFTERHATSVIIEYRLRLAHHAEPFAVEAEYMDNRDMKELIRELLRSFCTYHEPSFRDIVDIEERRDIRLRSETAWNTLHSMFRDKPNFSPAFLLEYPDDAGIPLCDLLHQYADDFLDKRPGGANAPSWSTPAFDAEECSDILYKLTSTAPADESTPALWPFLRAIRVYLRSPILHCGVVLVDCPSLDHLNYHSTRAVERYLRACDVIFAVTSIENVLSDSSIPDIVKRIARHRPLRIICTHSCDIVTRDVERKDAEVAWQAKMLRQQIDTLHKQVQRSAALRRRGVPGAIEQEARSRDMVDDMEFGLKKFLVERRNGRVAAQLIERYWRDVQMGDLKVFCVSGREYWANRWEEQGRAEVRLELSGVVDLRRYCRDVGAEELFDEAMAFIEEEVPACLGSLKVWTGGVDVIEVGREVEVREALKGLEGVLIKQFARSSELIHRAKRTLMGEFVATIVLPIREHRSEWRKVALEASKEWTKWDAQTYAAFCRHNGIHTTTATGPRNWNEDIVAPMRRHLQSNWDFFTATVEDTQDELLRSIDAIFDEMYELGKTHTPTAPTPTPLNHILTTTLPHHHHTLTRTIRTAFTALLSATETLEADTLHGHMSSHMAALMAPAYHAAARLSRTGTATAAATSSTALCSTTLPTPPHSPGASSSPSASPSLSAALADQRRKDILVSHVAGARVFLRLASGVEKKFEAGLEEIFREVSIGVEEGVRGDLRAVVCGAWGSSLVGVGMKMGLSGVTSS